MSGGLTINKVAKGQWISESNTLYKESIIPVRIACTRTQIEKIIDHTNDYYEQEAVYATKIGSEVIIKKNKNITLD